MIKDITIESMIKEITEKLRELGVPEKDIANIKLPEYLTGWEVREGCIYLDEGSRSTSVASYNEYFTALYGTATKKRTSIDEDDWGYSATYEVCPETPVVVLYHHGSCTIPRFYFDKIIILTKS